MKKITFIVLCISVMLLAGCKAKVTVITGDVSNISTDDASVNGYIGDYEDMPAAVGVYLGTSEDNMKKVNSDTTPNNKKESETIDVTYDLSVNCQQKLEPDTTYYYRFYARVEGQEKLGDIKSFTTASSLPEAQVNIDLKDAEKITGDSAKITATISGFSEQVTQAGLYMGTSEDDMMRICRDNNPYSDYPDLTHYDVFYNLNMDTKYVLEPNTTYYYQVYAQIGDTEKRSEIKTFTTTDEVEETSSPEATEAPAE